MADLFLIGFAALTVSPRPGPLQRGAATVLEVGGAVLRIAAEASPALVAAVVRSLVAVRRLRPGQRMRRVHVSGDRRRQAQRCRSASLTRRHPPSNSRQAPAPARRNAAAIGSKSNKSSVPRFSPEAYLEGGSRTILKHSASCQKLDKQLRIWSANGDGVCEHWHSAVYGGNRHVRFRVPTTATARSFRRMSDFHATSIVGIATRVWLRGRLLCRAARGEVLRRGISFGTASCVLDDSQRHQRGS